MARPGPVKRASLKAALLGLSHPHSTPHLATLQNLPEVGEIVAWDPAFDLRRHGALLANRAKVGLCTRDLGAVLGLGDIDFAILCVPTDVAADLACRVAASGIHLLAEKPVGLDPAEIRKVIRACRRAGVTASVLYINRFNPAVLEARRLVRAGTFGALMTIEVRLLTTQVRFRNPGGWLFDRRRAGGGILTWLGCHYLDLVRHISGDEIAAVSAQVATRSGERIDVEDVAALSLRYRSGAVGTFTAGYVLAFSGGGYLNPGGFDAYLAWNGRKGRVVIPERARLHVESAVRRGPPKRDMLFPEPASASYGGAPGEAFVRRFIGAFARGEEPPTSLGDALRTAEVLKAVERSVRTRREVRL